MPKSGYHYWDNIMLYLIEIDQVHDFGSTRSKVILI